MESEARYTWVGVVVVALFMLLSGGIYWLSGAADRLPTQRYTVYFDNQSLEGLQIGSDVRMQGIKVGRVEDYTIVPERARTVRVILEVDKRAPVLEGVKAVVARNMLTGLAAVELENTARTGTPLMQVPPGELYPVIEEGVPDLTRVATMVEDIGLTGHETLQRLNSMLSDDNQKALHGTLHNLDRLTGDLRQTVPEMHATLASARRAAERLDVTGEALIQVAQDTDAHVGRIVQSAENTLSEVEQTMQAARGTLNRFEQEVDAASLQLKISADLATQEVQATGQSLRQAGEALQAAGRGLSEPGRLLYGPLPEELGPGEEKP